MTNDIAKHFRKKKILQNYDFLYVWNANLIIYKKNFLFVIILLENQDNMSADTMNLRPELDFNHYIDVTDNISINLADLDNLNPPILNFNECTY